MTNTKWRDVPAILNATRSKSSTDIIKNYNDSLSLNYLVNTLNKAEENNDVHKLTQLSRITIWWQLASSTAIISVFTIMVIGGVTMSTFVWTLFVNAVAIVGLLLNFGTDGGPTILLAIIVLVIHVWISRIMEVRTRNDFIQTLRIIDEIMQDEEKFIRKSKALEEKLRLTEEQLRLIQSMEDKMLGDTISELGAWKIAVDTDVIFDRKLGSGTFGIVYLAMMRETGRQVAVKQLLNDQVDEENMERFFSEIILHSKLHHPHLVEMIGASWEPPNLCLVLAYCEGGDLFHLLEENYSKLTWRAHKLRMMKEISQAMAYLHGHSIMHRDVKTANILVDCNLKMRVSDFGESRVVKQKEDNMTTVGTNFYIAPEVFRGDSSYDVKADVFGVGMIMLAMCTKGGSLRDFFVDQMGMKVKINSNHASLRLNEGWRPDMLKHNGKITGRLDMTEDPKMRSALSKFITALISQNPADRPCMTEVVKAFDNLDKWVCVSPPKWADEEPMLCVGAKVCHPIRGQGTIASFDGFNRVHVLYDKGTDLYRRYTEDDWFSKMSIGTTVVNPHILNDRGEKGSRDYKRENSRKVGADFMTTSGATLMKDGSDRDEEMELGGTSHSLNSGRRRGSLIELSNAAHFSPEFAIRSILPGGGGENG